MWPNLVKKSLLKKFVFFVGQEKLGARSYRGPAVQQK